MQELGPRQKAWLAALRSGNYEQCSRRLELDGKYCCLGVATVLAGAACGIRIELDASIRSYFALRGSLGRAICPIQHEGNYYVTLAEMNDKGLSFSNIADCIAQHPNELFIEAV